MKYLQTLLATLLLAAVTSQAALFSSTGVNNNIGILDGNPAGISSSINVSGLLWSTTDVNVTINVTGGFNGDLYAYLSYNGTRVDLVNRVGTGSGDAIQTTWGFSAAGFSNITLDDAAIANGSIHGVSTPLASTSYTPDGGSLNSFNTMNPNGAWTLFISDMAGGGGASSSTLVGWSLDVTAVPEPVNVALGIFAGLGLVVGVCRSCFGKRTNQI